eukprot:s692_g12.t1
MDLMHWEGEWYMLLVDEATRFKACGTIQGQNAEDLMQALLNLWIYIFGPPERLVMDQQVALMSHDIGGEFERLGVERSPRGTTAGHGADQHTGTGIVERHVQLMKLTMFKLRAELQRQGLNPQPDEIGRESAMAQNLTLSYKGVTPAMSVFGVLPRGFYEVESEGVLSYEGATQTDISVFERAMRIRQTALAQAQQAVIEDRVKDDPGWRGPALLLRLDADDGVAVIQYQGKPYLVALRHIRPFRGIYHVAVQKPEVDEMLYKVMRYVESLSDYKVYLYGWVRDRKDKWIQLPKNNEEANRTLQKATVVSSHDGGRVQAEQDHYDRGINPAGTDCRSFFPEADDGFDYGRYGNACSSTTCGRQQRR